MGMRFAIAALAAAGIASGAGAADFTQADHNGAPEIARGDFAKAERVLIASRQVSPRDPELMLNLAMVYAKSGRADAARIMYRQVQAQPDEEMLMSGGNAVSSHALASAGLLALDRVRLAGN